MNDIAKETADLAKKARENLEKRVTEIEDDSAEAIRRIAKESEAHTAAKIAQIREEYLMKTEKLDADYEKNEKNLRGKIFHDVLYSP